MISIIIPNLHSPLIGEVVAALERQTARHQIGEILVVGQDRYNQIPASARAITTPAPISAAAARNLGARHTTGEYLLFLDADCVAAPDLIERLLARHAAGYAVVGGAMALDPASYWVLCDNLLSFHDALVSAPAGPRAHLASFCLSIARAAFEQAGGFDERFPGAAGEDIDLSVRLRGHGHTLYFDPAVRVEHHPPRSSARAMWRHQRGFGRGYYQVLRQQAGRLPSPLLKLHPRAAPLLLAAAPALACTDLARLARASAALRARPAALPGILWGRMGWYVGVGQGLRAQARCPEHSTRYARIGAMQRRSFVRRIPPFRWLSQLYNAVFTSRAAGFEQELSFWDDWFRTKGLAWPTGYAQRFDPQLELSEYHRSFIDQLPQDDIRILDVGAGPLTLLGKVHPTKRITITATDVLAAQYSKLIEKYGVKPLTPTIFADVERLTEQFGENMFDFVNAQNCIDHTQHPLEAIRQMLAVAKPGCFVALRHVENEAENANYVGLHKWNFTLRDGRLVLKSKLAQIDVAHEIGGLGTVESYKDGNWVIARIAKHAAS